MDTYCNAWRLVYGHGGQARGFATVLRDQRRYSPLLASSRPAEPPACSFTAAGADWGMVLNHSMLIFQRWGLILVD